MPDDYFFVNGESISQSRGCDIEVKPLTTLVCGKIMALVRSVVNMRVQWGHFIQHFAIY